MSEPVQEEHEEEAFDFGVWIESTSLSPGGRTKLAKAEITDLKALLLVTPADIVAVKLAPGDRAKLSTSIAQLRVEQKASDVKPTSADSTPPVQPAGVLPVSEASGGPAILSPTS
jgi:hypothetical protein